MSTAQQQPTTVVEYLRTTEEIDPKTALELALAENERLEIVMERERMEARANADVKIGPKGIEATNLGGLWRLARIYADSDLVPDHFRGKPANCFIGIQMAMRCKCEPFAFLQKCYVVHGKPGIEAQLAIAIANQSGLFRHRIKYRLEGNGDSRCCTAMTTMQDTGEGVTERISVELAKKMGWWTKRDSLWPKMTDKMLKYRSAKWLIDVNCPEVLMGIQTVDELLDADGAPQAAEATPPKSLDGLADRLSGEDAGETTQPTTDAGDPEGQVASEPEDKPPVEEATEAPTQDEQGGNESLVDNYIAAMYLTPTLTAANELQKQGQGDAGLNDQEKGAIKDAHKVHCLALRDKRGEGSNAPKQQDLLKEPATS